MHQSQKELLRDLKEISDEIGEDTLTRFGPERICKVINLMLDKAGAGYFYTPEEIISGFKYLKIPYGPDYHSMSDRLIGRFIRAMITNFESVNHVHFTHEQKEQMVRDAIQHEIVQKFRNAPDMLASEMKSETVKKVTESLFLGIFYIFSDVLPIKDKQKREEMVTKTIEKMDNTYSFAQFFEDDAAGNPRTKRQRFL